MFTRELPAISSNVLVDPWTLPPTPKPLTLLRSDTNFLATYIRSSIAQNKVRDCQPPGFVPPWH